MRYRIAIWAAAGFFVAACWGLYFAMASKDNPIPTMITMLARISCPIVIAGAHYPISVYWVLVVNAATYALAGAVVETLRKKLHPAA